jgi:hypothetical protein
MLEWVPSAICFVFGHNWYTPDTPENEGDTAGLEYCRRCTAAQPTMDQRLVDAFNKSHEQWKARGWVK